MTLKECSARWEDECSWSPYSRRGTEANRQILQIESKREDQFDYRVKLIEELRADYWTGKPLKLKHIKEFP